MQFVLAALAALVVPVLHASPAKADDQASVLVTTTKLRKGSLQHTVTAYGTVQADPSARQAVMAPAAAMVAKIYVRVGEEVKKGAPLVQLIPNPQTHADYAKARAALAAANAQLRHTRELLSQYLATKQQLADAENAQAAARAALTALETQGAGGPKTLTAPFHATVTKIGANSGMLVSEGTPLLELAPPNALVLRAGVVPMDASVIKSGDKATIKPIGAETQIDARVLLRGAVVDPRDGLVPIEIALPPNTLLPGEAARVTIATRSINGFVVPHKAILINDNGHPYVVQVVNMTARLVPVQVMVANGDKNVISGKLDPKAPLVLSGAYQLQNGMKVRFSNSSKPAR
jgi:membrane fusion protein (multidrug efflux system)